MKWCDLLRVKAEFPVNLWPNAAQAYDHWIRDMHRGNMPYSEFARQLLTANGSNFLAPAGKLLPVRREQGPEGNRARRGPDLHGRAHRDVAKGEARRLRRIFSRIGFKATGEWKEEIVYYNGFDDSKRAGVQTGSAGRHPGPLSPGTDPRAVFANWLISSKFALCRKCREPHLVLAHGARNRPGTRRFPAG